MYSFGLALQSNLDKVLSCNLFFSGFYAFDLITICPARTTALVPTKAKLFSSIITKVKPGQNQKAKERFSWLLVPYLLDNFVEIHIVL